jgi:hypothetical protein
MKGTTIVNVKTELIENAKKNLSQLQKFYFIEYKTYDEVDAECTGAAGRVACPLRLAVAVSAAAVGSKTFRYIFVEATAKFKNLLKF